MSKRVDPEVRAVLAGAVVDGASVRLSDQLSEALYARVAKVLTAIGGHWHSGKGVHEFTEDPRMAIARYVAGDTNWHDRAADSFVSTPPALAEELVGYEYADVAQLPDGARVLEPSAGDGALVQAILEAHPGVEVFAVEPHAGRGARAFDAARAMVKGGAVKSLMSIHVQKCTFEDFARRVSGPLRRLPDWQRPAQFAAVVMNPPFRGPGNATLWIDHVRLAWSLLAPGGLLVSVVPDGYRWRNDRAHTELRELVDEHGGRYQRLPADTFAGGMACGVLTMAKALPDDGPTPWILRPAEGEPVRVDTLRLSARAAAATPVQLYRHPSGEDNVARYMGRCATCWRRLWGNDDGDNTPAGPLQSHSFSYGSLDPFEDRMVGPIIGQCTVCYSSGEELRARARALAEPLWTPAPPDDGEPAAEPESAGAGAFTLADLLASVSTSAPGAYVDAPTSGAGEYAGVRIRNGRVRTYPGRTFPPV